MEDVEQFIQDVAREAGELILPMFGTEKAQYHKSDSRSDAVTKADIIAEEMMIERIQKKYPDHGIISEERGRINADVEYVWIMDPIDGTLNFASNVPLWGVMLALARNKKVMFSVVYLPVMKEMVFAKRGGGTFLNGTRIQCSTTSDFDNSIGCISSRSGMALDFNRALFDFTEGKNTLFSAFGSIAASARYIAAGERDWNVSFHGGTHDYAPTSLILEESGCMVTGTDGTPWTTESQGLIAANPQLYPTLWSIVQKIKR